MHVDDFKENIRVSGVRFYAHCIRCKLRNWRCRATGLKGLSIRYVEACTRYVNYPDFWTMPVVSATRYVMCLEQCAIKR